MELSNINLHQPILQLYKITTKIFTSYFLEKLNSNPLFSLVNIKPLANNSIQTSSFYIQQNPNKKLTHFQKHVCNKASKEKQC